MRGLSEVIEGLFDGGWEAEAEDYVKLAYYINTIKKGNKREWSWATTYQLKNPEFSVEDIWKIIEGKALKKTTRDKIQKGRCYVELAKTGIYILKCENVMTDIFKDRSAIGSAVNIIDNSPKGIELNISKEKTKWGTNNTPTRKDTYEIPQEIFDIITR